MAFIAPIVIAFFLYQHKNLLPRPEIEKYALNPPIQVSELDLNITLGEQQIKQLPEKWTLVLTDPYQCANSACQLHATRMQQIRLALGKYQDQLNVGLLTTVKPESDQSPPHQAVTQRLKQHISDLYIIDAPAKDFAKLSPTPIIFQLSHY